MKKQEIQDEIKKARENLERLEAKLKEPEKFEFQSGNYRFSTTSWFEVSYDPIIKREEIVARTQKKEDCERLAKHLKNAAIIWQVAEFVNDGWVRDSKVVYGAVEVYYNYYTSKFDWCLAADIDAAIFKNIESGKKACEILNNQDTGYEI